MAKKSLIEWTESTWNPLTGCEKISAGCKNCYAERMANRLQKMGNPKYKNGFKLTLHPRYLSEPLRWKKPQIVFVCSMSDLFHKDVPDKYIIEVFETMNNASRHTFQVLTKRSDRLLKMATKLNWTNNIWLGVTVESAQYIHRINDLAQINAQVKFLSLEPLLDTISSLPLESIDWTIVGGESGFHSRPIEKAWVRDIRDQCLDANVPFFFKQWGGTNKKAAGRLLDGKIWDETPQLQII